MCFYDVDEKFNKREDPTFKIKYLSNYVIKNSQRLYYPRKELCIDESMIRCILFQII